MLSRAQAKCQPQISHWPGCWPNQQEVCSPGPAFLIQCYNRMWEANLHIALSFLSFDPEWRPVKRTAQLMCAAHQTHPHCLTTYALKWGCGACVVPPATSYPVVERVAMFWLYLSGKWIRGPMRALSPLLSGLVSLPCSAWEEPPPDRLLSTHKWEVWPLLKHAGHGSCELPPTSAFWLCWLEIFNLIYLFPLFKTKQFLAHWKKKKAKCFVPF